MTKTSIRSDNYIKPLLSIVIVRDCLLLKVSWHDYSASEWELRKRLTKTRIGNERITKISELNEIKTIRNGSDDVRDVIRLRRKTEGKSFGEKPKQKELSILENIFEVVNCSVWKKTRIPRTVERGPRFSGVFRLLFF